MKLRCWNGLSPLGHSPSWPWRPAQPMGPFGPRQRQGNPQGARRRRRFRRAVAQWGGAMGRRDGWWGGGPDLVTGEGGGSPEGGFHKGAARPKGNGGEGRRSVVEVGDWRFKKVVGTRAVARRWSATARQGIYGRGVGAGEMAWGVGGGGNSSTATTRKGIRAHVADVHGGARATSAWSSSCRVRMRPATGRHLSGAWDWQVGPTLFWFFKIFKHPNFDIWIGDLSDVQILPNFAGR
jgi:hypothetical protein